MKTIHQTDILKDKIALLRLNREYEKLAIQQQYQLIQNSLTISAIVEQGVTEFYKNVTHKNKLLPTVLSLVGGYLSKKIVMGDSKSITKTLLGYGIQFVTTKLISKMTNQ
ncbi:MAG: hypothetical protein KA523_07500 [Flavobacterium sp.]|nr:hypothetical protein [Flavobacterium sp.]